MAVIAGFPWTGPGPDFVNGTFPVFNPATNFADQIDGLGGNDTLFGLGGDNSILGGTGNNSIDGGSGNDTVDGQAGTDTIEGGIGNDNLLGGDAGDIIFGGTFGGGDVVEGNDLIQGGAGADIIIGDNFFGGFSVGSGLDTITGGGGDDIILAGGSNDFTVGDTGDDTMLGDAGGDNVRGSAGNDSLFGGLGEDFVVGEEPRSAAIDRVPLNDTLYGGAARDTIYGGVGRDELWGDGLNEPGVAVGASGLLVDVRGADVFQFDPGDSVIGTPDRVMDFQSRFDNIELDGVPNGSFQNFVMAGGTFADEAGALDQANILLNGETGVFPAVQFVGVRVGSDTYLFIDYNRDGFADEDILFVGISDLHPGDIRNDY